MSFKNQWGQTVSHSLLSIAANCLILTLLCFGSAKALAYAPQTATQSDSEDQAHQLDLIQARKLYQEALAALRSGQRKQFHQLQAQLVNYPLFPYLSYYEYRRYMETAEANEIADFIAANEGSPIGFRLRRTWLKHLADKKQWSLYQENYRPTSNASYNCDYYWALYQNGKQEEALIAAKDLWLVGRSQHKNCDPLFNKWQQTSAYNDDIIWQRIALSIKNGNPQLASYLSKSLNNTSDKEKVDTWIQVRRDPKKLRHLDLITKDNSKNREIVLYGLARLLRKDIELALQLWPEYEKRFQFTNDELSEFNLNVAKYLAYKYDDHAEDWLRKVDTNYADYDIHQRRIRLAMKQGRWADVYHWITLLPGDTGDKPQWKYWKAAALEKNAAAFSQAVYLNQDQLPQNEDLLTWQADPMAVHQNFFELVSKPSSFSLEFDLNGQWQEISQLYLDQAQALYNEIALDRNYYSFLASERLGKPLSLNEMEISFNDRELALIEQEPGIKRARELYILGEMNDARSEWYYAVQNFDATKKSTAAKLAELWGWHSQAILTASSSSHLDNLDLRFPRAYHDTIAYHASKLGLNSAWVFSLIRQESAFMAEARSHAGAMGLMQLMPSTAKQVSRKIGVKYRNTTALLDPRRNVKLGTAYLSELLTEFNGNIVLATAAYNAGPHRVKKWRPDNQAIEGDVWIETIPFSETRNYVQNIMTYQAIYRHQLGRAPKMSSSLSFIYPKANPDSPTVAANDALR